MTYGYCRISTPKQIIERQIRNIAAAYPHAVIVQEVYTGKKMLERPKWTKLFRTVRSGDVIVFDSVSRMSRNAADGIKAYMELYSRGVELHFLKEPGIDTTTYKNAVPVIAMTGDDADLIIEGINKYLVRLAEKQIELAFAQAQKEVDDLSQRTKEGIVTAKLNGKRVGNYPGRQQVSRIGLEVRDKIIRYSRDFKGSLNDIDCMKLCGCSRNTYYKYKRKLSEEQEFGGNE